MTLLEDEKRKTMMGRQSEEDEGSFGTENVIEKHHEIEPPEPVPEQPDEEVPPEECKSYYLKVTESNMDFAKAQSMTPVGCALASVRSLYDLGPMAEAAGGSECYTGVATDKPVSGGSVEGWYNLIDGSVVPNTYTAWRDGEPNNNPGGQTRATINQSGSGKLRDVAPSSTFSCAVYACCESASGPEPAPEQEPEQEPESSPEEPSPSPPVSNGPPPTGARSIEDFVYKGAFRLATGKFGGNDDTFTLDYS